MNNVLSYVTDPTWLTVGLASIALLGVKYSASDRPIRVVVAVVAALLCGIMIHHNFPVVHAYLPGGGN